MDKSNPCSQKILAGENSENTRLSRRLSCIDRKQFAMGVIGPHKRYIRLAWDIDIGGVAAAAGNKTPVLPTQNSPRS
jgi:hypothetical protein